jgi:hypothetical protein
MVVGNGHDVSSEDTVEREDVVRMGRACMQLLSYDG